MITKYGTPEKIETLTEEENEVIDNFKTKTGKTLLELEDEERKELREELDNV